MLVVRVFPPYDGGCTWLMRDGGYCPDKKRATRFHDLWRVMKDISEGRFGLGDVFDRLPAGRTLIIEHDYPEMCSEPRVIARLEKY